MARLPLAWAATARPTQQRPPRDFSPQTDPGGCLTANLGNPSTKALEGPEPLKDAAQIFRLLDIGDQVGERRKEWRIPKARNFPLKSPWDQSLIIQVGH